MSNSTAINSTAGNIAAIVDRYIAIWNETDAGVRRGLIARTCLLYTSPSPRDS